MSEDDFKNTSQEGDAMTVFLFDISTEVKSFYETPVVFVTMKDYSDIIFNTMCYVRMALNEKKDRKDIMDAIVDFHLQWLHAVNELDFFKRRITDLPREELYQAISYTIDCMANRLKYYQRYMEKNKKGLSTEQHHSINAEIEIVEEMHKDVTHVLLEKLKCLRNFLSDDEFKLKVNDYINDLLNWLDKINDGLSVQLSKHINFNLPQLTGDLTKTLQQIVDELSTSQSQPAKKIIEELKDKGKELGTMIRSTAGHSLEISKVVEKINILDHRIKRLETEQSSAVMALVHKKDYLEKRLASIENLKLTLKSLMQLTDVQLDEVSVENLCICEDFFQLKIFNHLLPQAERERLVTELCYLWDLAVVGSRSHKSIISILSADEMKEVYTDELGNFYIDGHSRKVYRKPDDETLYQPNEKNVLVPLTDDEENIYYYDECGRYFIDSKTRQRVYKSHATASEYMLDSSGVLLKIKEERDGITYYYDNYGRYYVNNEGKHIYRDADSMTEYENDGLGNLVRIRSQLDLFELCPQDVNVTEDFKYLKKTVGLALRECIADVILQQPADPIKYLSVSLMKFRENMELKEKRAREKEELDIEREIRIAEERAAAERAAMEAALQTQGGSETSYDSNLIKYTSMRDDDIVSFGASTK